MPPRKRKVAPSQTVNSVTDSLIDFDSMKVAELKAECKKRSLVETGKKLDLVKRLKDSCSNSTTKKVKKEEDADEEKSTIEKIKECAAEEKRNKKKTFQVDSLCPSAGKVVDDFDCMLNQTNIGHNNNKFYIIQMIEDGGNYYVWNRWGRVGENGSNAMKGPFNTLDTAEKEFRKKFKDKTKNNWENRDNFVPASGKYTMLEMQGEEEDEEKIEMLHSLDASPIKTQNPKSTLSCTLDKPTQSLIELIFDNDMFKEAMSNLNLDVKKMPLGKLSKAQIAKGFEVLEELEKAVKGKKSANLQELTSRFYTQIPHAFGRMRPPLINDPELVQRKMDMLTVLADIEIAQSIQKEVKKEEVVDVPHVSDTNYGLLNCNLKHIKPEDDTYKMIDTYIQKTKNSYSKLKLLDLWEVDRIGEDSRFAQHDDIVHRKLLWHGTNVAVVVAILKSGLRIMPHSGGRVGKGIYFASENAKSAGYVGTTRDSVGIMFLNEVALGECNVITRDDSSLRHPPKGYDSVLAQGRTEPDPKKDKVVKIDNHDVIVPQGSPINTKETGSSFSESEYLVYKESQNRIRYLLKMKFN